MLTENIDGINFTIDEFGTLKRMNHCSKARDVVIPREICGERVIALGKFFADGDYCKVTIPDCVLGVEEFAFESASVKIVDWSSNCEAIPRECFYNSSIKYLNNISHVILIDNGAFRNSFIESITWPDACPEISAECFSGSKLRYLDNVSNILKICTCAFKNTIDLQLDLSGVFGCTFEKGAFFTLEQNRVVLPYYVDEDKVQPAFDRPY